MVTGKILLYILLRAALLILLGFSYIRPGLGDSGDRLWNTAF